MDNALFARSQMAVSLGFHIVFASIGVTMPLLMVISEWLWLRTKDPDYLALTKSWAKGTAVLFAIGAVSGTVLSFELGLLFPAFMRHAGSIIGMPFSLEGFAFFTEAIFLGIYLYGWDRVSPAAHLAAGGVVAASGALSALFVTIANAWMNAPVGFTLVDGQFAGIDPWRAMLSPFVWHEVPHMLAAAYLGTACAVAGIHAWLVLRTRRPVFHRKALTIAVAVLIPFALVQPLIGHVAGQQVARHQPLKLAAVERHYETGAHAPLRIGPVAIPGALSWLATGSSSGVVRGLRDFPESDWPSAIVRPSFQVMVALGTYLALVALVAIALRPRRWTGRRFLWALVLAGPMGFVATEAGWIVTEVGRQPWTIYGILRTADAVTPVPGLAAPFFFFGAVYLVLSAIVVRVLWRHVGMTTGGGRA